MKQKVLKCFGISDSNYKLIHKCKVNSIEYDKIMWLREKIESQRLNENDIFPFNANFILVPGTNDQEIELQTRKLKYNLDNVLKDKVLVKKIFAKPDIFHEFLVNLLKCLLYLYDNLGFSAFIQLEDVYFESPNDISMVDRYIKFLLFEDRNSQLTRNNNNQFIQANMDYYIYSFLLGLRNKLEKHLKLLLEFHIFDKTYLYGFTQYIGNSIGLKESIHLDILDKITKAINQEYQFKVMERYNLDKWLIEIYKFDKCMHNKNSFFQREKSRFLNNNLDKTMKIVDLKFKIDQDLDKVISKLREYNPFLDYFVYFNENYVNVRLFLIDYFIIFEDNSLQLSKRHKVNCLIAFAIFIIDFLYPELYEIQQKSLEKFNQNIKLILRDFQRFDSVDKSLIHELTSLRAFLNSILRDNGNDYNTDNRLNVSDCMNKFQHGQSFMKILEDIVKKNDIGNNKPELYKEISLLRQEFSHHDSLTELFSRFDTIQAQMRPKSSKVKPLKVISISDDKLEKLIQEQNGFSLAKIYRNSGCSENEFISLLEKNYPELIYKNQQKDYIKYFNSWNGSFHKIITLRNHHGENGEQLEHPEYNAILYEEDYLFEGILKNGKKTGYGKIYYSNLTSYIGNWNENLRDGNGVEYSYNGNERYSGNWKQNKYHGKGKLVYVTGQIYEGEFFEGLTHGKGRILTCEGRVLCSGEWEKGKKKEFFEGNKIDPIRISKIKIIEEKKFDEFEIVKKEKEGEGDDIELKKEIAIQNCGRISREVMDPRRDLSDGGARLENRQMMSSLSNQGKNNMEAMDINRLKSDKISISNKTNDIMGNSIQSNDPSTMNKNNTIRQHNGYDIIGCKYGVIITKDEENRLKDNLWLNSNNIRFFMRYLKEKHEKEYWNEINDSPSTNFHSLKFIKMLNFKRIFYFPDDAFTILTMQTLKYDEKTWNYQNMQCMTRQFFKVGFLIFDLYDRLLFVINRNNKHWSLAEINCELIDKFQFIIYDSSIYERNQDKNQSAKDIFNALLKYCESEINAKCCQHHQNTAHDCSYRSRLNKVEYYIYPTNQQRNSYDCGVFVCGFMNDITEQKEKVDFSQGDAKKLRKFMHNQYKNISMDFSI